MPVEGLLISFTGVNENHQPVMNWNSRALGERIDIKEGRSELVFNIDPLLLHKGRYLWNLWVSNGGIDPMIYAVHAGSFYVDSDQPPTGDIPYLPDPAGFKIVTAAGTRTFGNPRTEAKSNVVPALQD